MKIATCTRWLCFVWFMLLVLSLPGIAAAEGGPLTTGEEASQSLIPERISAGDSYTCGVKSDGTVACWGYNHFGQATPPGSAFLQLSAGGAHTCGVKTEGTLACWGRNNEGQTNAPPGVFTEVSAGENHTCAVWKNGPMVCWGWNIFGQSSVPNTMRLPVLVK